VITVHDIGPYLERNSGEHAYGHRVHQVLDVIAVNALHRATAVVAVSDWTRQTLIAALGLPATRIGVIPLGVDQDRYHPRPVPAGFRERYGLTGDSRILLYVGNDEPRKNIRALMEALRIVKARIDKALLVKVGLTWEGPHGSRRLAEESAVSGAVRFLGEVPEEDLPLFYNVADAVVMPSLYEGFGLPALEAMASGTPLVAGNAGAVGEVTGSSGAILVEPRDVTGLAAAVVDVLLDRQLSARLSHAGLLRAALFSWERTAERTLDLYRSLVQSEQPTVG
jgi:glycosyltransferase involved in cell wall biosynthesis